MLAESRPRNKAERDHEGRIKARIGRPKIGKCVSVISPSIERGLLEELDTSTRSFGLKRS
jgi:hypothetical protein